jgi:transposase InsO family protein
MEDFPTQPCWSNGIDRFLYRADVHDEGVFVFMVLEHGRRKVLHFNVTEHRTAAWTAQQIVEAFVDREPARYLIRDRGSIYGTEVRLRIKSLGMEEVLTAPQSPWQNPYAERLIGSIRKVPGSNDAGKPG